jgi:hypothetical protein
MFEISVLFYLTLERKGTGSFAMFAATRRA